MVKKYDIWYTSTDDRKLTDILNQIVDNKILYLPEDKIDSGNTFSINEIPLSDEDIIILRLAFSADQITIYSNNEDKEI